MSKKNVEWEKLVEESLSGSQRSSNELMKSTEGYLKAMSLNLFKKIIPDVISHSLMKIWKNLHTFDPDKAKYITWATIIMQRSYYRHYNKLNREKDTLIHTDNLFESAVQDSYSEAESLEYEEYITSLRELLISDPSYTYLYHYYILKMKYEEISEHLKVNISTVKTRIRREKKILKEVLPKFDDIY